MVRDFLVQVIASKKALNARLHQLELDAAKIDDSLLEAEDNRLRDLQVQRLEIESEQLKLKRELVRAQLFGVWVTSGFVNPCIYCFIEHDVQSEMVEIPPKILGARLVKCTRCGAELLLND